MAKEKRFLDPNSATYKAKLSSVLREDYGSAYIQCQKCGNPTNKQYICSWCGSDNPTMKEGEE